jgi:type IV pilus assembly protein PilV
MTRCMVAPLRRCQRGGSLIDGLVALLVLSLGVLGMARFQASTIAEATEGQQRVLATQVAEELLSLALVDAANAGCYELPAAGACGSITSRNLAEAWSVRASAALPAANAVVTNGLDGRLQVQFRWVGKGSGDVRQVELSTDVRR